MLQSAVLRSEQHCCGLRFNHEQKRKVGGGFKHFSKKKTTLKEIKDLYGKEEFTQALEKILLISK